MTVAVAESSCTRRELGWGVRGQEEGECTVTIMTCLGSTDDNFVVCNDLHLWLRKLFFEGSELKRASRTKHRKETMAAASASQGNARPPQRHSIVREILMERQKNCKT